ncbi:MAG TPA: hypothetical protein ENJ02_04440 [Chloroflexi bacterium]|nr:hypothetical protein [Chloroflexota bacterium]
MRARTGDGGKDRSPPQSLFLLHAVEAVLFTGRKPVLPSPTGWISSLRVRFPPAPSVLLRQGDALCIHRAATAFDEYAFPRGARKALPAMSCRTITPENFDLDTPPPPPGRSMCVPLLLLPEWLEKHGYEATAYDPRLGFILRPSASTSSSDHAD